MAFQDFFHAALTEPFLRQALLVGLLAALAGGLIGPYVVVKRIGYLGGGIAHTVLAGMGIAYFLGGSPIVGAFICALVAAVIIGVISLYSPREEDTVINALWAVGMSVGVLFISQTPGYSTNLTSYLFGNLLLTPPGLASVLSAIVAGLVLVLLLVHRSLTAVIFDEEFASLRGVPARTLYILLLCLVAVSVVVLLQAIGLIMVIALLTLPAALAGHHVRSISAMMLIASLAGMLFIVVGMAISWVADLPSGATIVLVAGLGYFVSISVQHLLKPYRQG
ncbi:metal ABC transporter permease [Larsenimonas rhizosphaerae]|uniref:Metal ABC transporter permease n=1 Tax=Larsenimonas rhizosphaerae TaxID=2944682 RepID=A0AA42CT94_9GAMM|nr:metal ABC transporter permease [Larsenimonas rhizosphaerae]MCM2130698.1 metal ABC transporter permease [Larsenimonas rhizosphaerae]MCX2523402.1 metal ABC transporter permease [Larsenimonas rhizosphaerae]